MPEGRVVLPEKLGWGGGLLAETLSLFNTNSKMCDFPYPCMT